MEYHFVNVLILLFLLTYTHRTNWGTEITGEEKAAIENGSTVGSALFTWCSYNFSSKASRSKSHNMV